MRIQLRQICLIARELSPIIDDLTYVLGIKTCFVDPRASAFGLENTVMSIGRNFLEVVSPVKTDSPGERFLKKRRGDGGYMVICQAESKEAQQAIRTRALVNGFHIAYESEDDECSICQIHPKDMIATIFEINRVDPDDFTGNWVSAGGMRWKDSSEQSSSVEFVAVELQSPNRVEIADRWARVAGLPVKSSGDELYVELNNARIRFVEQSDGRGPGLSGMDLAVSDLEGILARAKQRHAFVSDHELLICGTRIHLHKTNG